MNSELFKYKFKRDPKVWTISSVHNLYIKALNRHNIRINMVRELIDEIVKLDSKTVYHEINGKVIKRVFSYYKEYNSWASSSDILDFSDKNRRENKLEFILSSDKEFKLGEKYHELKKLSNNYHLIIHKRLSDMVEKELRNKFRDIPCHDDVLIIDIDGYKYSVILENQYKNQSFYKKFKLSNQINGEIII